METSRYVFFILVILNISSIVLSLRCQKCGPDGQPCSDDANVTSVDCDGFADRCMTVSLTTGLNTMMMKNCAHSTMICQEQGLGYPCKEDLIPDGASCDIECCEGDLCNQASPEEVNTTAYNSTTSKVPDSWLMCEMCGTDGESCDGSNVTSVQCGGFADRCMTISMTVGSNTMIMKNCAHSTINCQEHSQYNPCKQVDSLVGSCNIECCEGNLCNQASPGEANTTLQLSNSTQPEVAASSLKCEACGPDGNPCGGDNVTNVACAGWANRCMTVSMTIGSRSMMVKNCAHSTLSCQEKSQYNPCKQAASFGGSCNIDCCEGDLCNQASPGEGITTAYKNSTTSEVPASSSLKCQSCGPMGDPCDETNVTSVDCGGLADRCLTVSMNVGDIPMLMKTCGYSTLNCQVQSQYNPCKFVPIGASCKVTCCEGDMCNLVSPSTTVAPSTTVSSPPTPGTEPPPTVVKGRFFKVNSFPVCFGTKNDDYGKFSVPSNGDLAAVKLVHLYGYVVCYSGAKWSIWGCGGPRVNVVITTPTKEVILPPAELSDTEHWAIIPGYTPVSPELVLSVFSRPRPVTSGEVFHLWYGEDFIDDREGDNRGTVCSDVYVLLF